ncbi:MAG TPA: nucleotide exchange factor GrpE [Vicinamibacterales bacterium]|nr:nucleotide exchange factor GrpE [Vicinamibacterales bacterium]
MSDENITEPNSESPEPAEDTAIQTETNEVAALQQERDELLDRLLRKTAEFDNYRKRVEKERREQAEWAAADVLGDILTVLDDFDRALAIEAPPEAESYRAGFELIHRQLGDLLRKRGVTTLETLGTDFDPHLHQAVAYEESPGAREGEIVGELRRGYRLGDRLLRPALVRVAKAS